MHIKIYRVFGLRGFRDYIGPTIASGVRLNSASMQKNQELSRGHTKRTTLAI